MGDLDGWTAWKRPPVAFREDFEMADEQPHYYFHDPYAEPQRPDPELGVRTREALEALVEAGFIVKVTFPILTDPKQLWEVCIVRAGSDLGEWTAASTILKAVRSFGSPVASV